VDAFLLEPSDVAMKTVSFPLVLRDELKHIADGGICPVEFGVVILALDMSGELHRKDLIINEAYNFANKVAIADPSAGPEMVHIIR